jgi:multiple sugar transport system permease protein
MTNDTLKARVAGQSPSHHPARSSIRGGGKDPLRRLLRHVLLIALGLLMLYPLLWMVVSSLRTNDDIFRLPGLLLSTLKTANYEHGWHGLESPFSHYLLNSTIIAPARSSETLSPVRRPPAFARLEFRFKRVLFAVMLLTIMLPIHVIIVPQYIIFSQFGCEHVSAPDRPEVPGHRRLLRLLDGAVHPGCPENSTRLPAWTAAATSRPLPRSFCR